MQINYTVSGCLRWEAGSPIQLTGYFCPKKIGDFDAKTLLMTINGILIAIIKENFFGQKLKIVYFVEHMHSWSHW